MSELTINDVWQASDVVTHDFFRKNLEDGTAEVCRVPGSKEESNGIRLTSGVGQVVPLRGTLGTGQARAGQRRRNQQEDIEPGELNRLQDTLLLHLVAHIG